MVSHPLFGKRSRLQRVGGPRKNLKVPEFFSQQIGLDRFRVSYPNLVRPRPLASIVHGFRCHELVKTWEHRPKEAHKGGTWGPLCEQTLV